MRGIVVVIFWIIIISGPIIFYKMLIPKIGRIYKIFLIITGILAWLFGLFGTMALSTLSNNGGEPNLIFMLLAIVIGFVFATPPFLLASIFGRIEKLEEMYKLKNK